MNELSLSGGQSPAATCEATSGRQARPRPMIDYVIKNARLANHTGIVDIGFEHGRIAAIGSNIDCDAPTHDAEGCLCCGGLIETHIRLDKSRIMDRCAPEADRRSPAFQRVQPVK